MKAKKLPDFISFATLFSIESVIKSICNLIFEMQKESNDGVGFLGKQYSYRYCGKLHYVYAVQTWILDLLFELIKHYTSFGNKTITKNETLHLIKLYNTYSNKKPNCDVEDIFLYVYGFLGEQMKIETQGNLIDNFARENYILEFVSPKDAKYNINIHEIFKNETGYSEKIFSAMLILIWSYCNKKNPTINYRYMRLNGTYPFSNDDLFKVIDRYSATLDEIKRNDIGRQFFYSKPFIKIGDTYISVSPYLVLCLFTNSNYWIIRNYYNNLDNKSENFILAFGRYFELYVEEVFSNCLSANEYTRICESTRKRADWKLNILGREILIEQKSTISAIGIKQNNTDVEKLKNYIYRTWYKAAKQLNETENDLNLNEPVKIILLYEDYYKPTALDELYRLYPDLVNDGRLWLMTINELEIFMMIYSTAPDVAQRIFNKKYSAETKRNKCERDCMERDWMNLFTKEDIEHDIYLNNFGIYNQLYETLNILGEDGDRFGK